MTAQSTEDNGRGQIVTIVGIDHGARRARIKSGTFNFDEEFPGYRFKDELPSAPGSDKNAESCGDVFNKFLAHCEMRVSMDDMAFSTLDGYQRDPGCDLQAEERGTAV